MVFVIKSSPKHYWSFKNNIKLIKNIYISKIIFFKLIFFKNQFLQNLSNQIFKNLILIWFKGIETNNSYVYQKKFI